MDGKMNWTCFVCLFVCFVYIRIIKIRSNYIFIYSICRYLTTLFLGILKTLIPAGMYWPILSIFYSLLRSSFICIPYLGRNVMSGFNSTL